jgi:hypothetical protein
VQAAPFFFRPWKTGYQSFNNTLKAAFQAGADYFAEFDLVSCYELVDHTLLRAIVGAKVKDQDLLDLLFECLRAWTCHSSSSLGHGLPQGPEPSAFLAECLLFKLDGLNLKGVTCLRYIDDIKLLGQEAASLRRSLLRLDLASKELGLVPQAQKITLPRKVHSTKEILKTVPSLAKLKTPSGKVSQRALFKILKSSMRRHGNKWLIEDVTKFKFALFRLNPRVALLRRLGLLLADRPDLAPTLGQYFKKFPKNRAAASLLHSALKTDPVYDLAAASYVEAMDVCEPSKNYQAYRKTIRTIAGKSEEKSILLPIASSVFFGRRSTPAKAIALVRRAKDPRTKGILVHRLFGDSSTAPFSPLPAAPLLEELTKEADADLARYCAGLLLSRVSSNWKASGVNFSVQLLLFGLGLISKSPRKPGILETFFHVKMGILVPIDWRLALRADLPDAERRCLRLQKLMNSDPTARIMMLDTFNELLSQAFSLMEPSLAPTYKVVAGKNLHPDYGFWLNRPEFVAVVPRTVTWFRAVHAAGSKRTSHTPSRDVLQLGVRPPYL